MESVATSGATPVRLIVDTSQAETQACFGSFVMLFGQDFSNGHVRLVECLDSTSPGPGRSALSPEGRIGVVGQQLLSGSFPEAVGADHHLPF